MKETKSAYKFHLIDSKTNKSLGWFKTKEAADKANDRWAKRCIRKNQTNNAKVIEETQASQ